MLTKTNTIGMVGGMDLPVIRNFQVGYEAGAKYINKDVKVETIFAEDFEDPAKGKECATALYSRGADILILDEPTAVLTPQETDELFNVIRKLVGEMNKTVIIITHKLQEVLAISDRVSVMRQGELVGTLPTREANEEILAEMMIGKEVLFHDLHREEVQGKETLEVKNIKAKGNRGLMVLKGVSFSLVL